MSYSRFIQVRKLRFPVPFHCPSSDMGLSHFSGILPRAQGKYVGGGLFLKVQGTRWLPCLEPAASQVPLALRLCPQWERPGRTGAGRGRGRPAWAWPRTQPEAERQAGAGPLSRQFSHWFPCPLFVSCSATQDYKPRLLGDSSKVTLGQHRPTRGNWTVSPSPPLVSRGKQWTVWADAPEPCFPAETLANLGSPPTGSVIWGTVLRVPQFPCLQNKYYSNK